MATELDNPADLEEMKECDDQIQDIPCTAVPDGRNMVSSCVFRLSARSRQASAKGSTQQKPNKMDGANEINGPAHGKDKKVRDGNR